MFVLLEIVVSAISDSCKFNPSVLRESFGIPAVDRVVRHFIGLVLPKPELGRPHADTLNGSRIKNLKELRARTPTQVLRVLYYFDDERQAHLLVGGNKKGKNEKSFYKKLIQSAEMLTERYRP